MRKLGYIALALVLLIGGAAVWYWLAYPTYTYRYRLSIAVDVGGETRTASSVIEVRTITQPMGVIFSPIRNEVEGDAVFLDLGAKGNLVATLAFGPNGSEDYAGTLVPTLFDVGGDDLPKLETLRGSRELTGRFIPTLVTFGNLSDPKTARVVRPDEFEKAFGPDVHFQRAWIEMTTDPVTRRIEQRLPWITDMKARGLGGRIETRPGEFIVNVPFFTRG
jgi:hypothetical protein